MKKYILSILILLFIAYISIVKRVSVNANMEAVLIKKPWFLKESGIEPHPISTGTIWAVQSTEIKLISLSPFFKQETFLNTLSIENIPLSFNVELSFQYQTNKTPLLIQKFTTAEGWYKNLFLSSFRVSVESIIKQNAFKELQKNGILIENIEESLKITMQNFLNKENIPATLLSLHINSLLPPQKIIDAAVKTETEKEKKKLSQILLEEEELRKKTEEAKAQADKAYLKSMHISMREYLKLKKLELEKKKLDNQYFAIQQAENGKGTLNIEMKMGKK